MTRVLAFATARPRINALGPHVTEIVGAGGEVRLACWFDPAGMTEDAGLLEIHRVAGAQPNAEDNKPTRGSLWRRIRAKPVSEAADPAAQRWHDARDDPWVVRETTVADFLVALDQDAVYPVWELARAHPGVRASFGLHAVIAAMAGRLTLADGREVPTPRTAARRRPEEVGTRAIRTGPRQPRVR